MHVRFPFPIESVPCQPRTTPFCSFSLTIAAHSYPLASRDSIQCRHISIFPLSQQAFNFIYSRLLLSSPLQLVSRFRTKSSRRLWVSIGGGCTERRKLIGVVAMASWPGLELGLGLLPSLGKVALYFTELSLAVVGPAQAFREVNGENTRYSKFATSEGGEKKEEKKKKKEEEEAMIASKTGMFMIYFPAALLASVFLACRLEILPLAAFLEWLESSSSSSSWGASSGAAAAFWKNALVADAVDHRLVLVAAAMFVHFTKRVLEVLFVHKYSGTICVADSTQISISYAMQVCLLLYSQLLSAARSETPLPEAPFSNQLKWLGVVLFLIGVIGNAYHHWLLSHLRKDHGNNKKYVVPQGGLFDVFVCPHYVFEMIDMLGIALMSQTLFGMCMVWFVSWYLTGRAIASKQWYLKKVEGFPEERKVLIPGIF